MTERVRIEPTGHIRVRLGDQILADTDRGYVVHEVGLPDRFYVPRRDVRARLSEGRGKGTCPWKGEWKHLDVDADGRHIDNGAWTYDHPTPLAQPIRDFVAFYEDKVDRIEHA